MVYKTCRMVRCYGVICAAMFVLSACAITSSVKYGVLKEEIYHSSTNEFSISIPVSAVVNDGLHPLGGFVTVSNLHEPIIRRGVAYFRAVMPSNGLTQKEMKGIVEAGHNNWVKNYASRELANVIHKEWVDVNGMPAYFTVVEGASPGLLVKPGSYSGAISFLKSNYSYVLFEVIDAPYQLKGSDDLPETTAIKDPQNRLDSISEYLSSVDFKSAPVKFPMK